MLAVQGCYTRSDPRQKLLAAEAGDGRGACVCACMCVMCARCPAVEASACQKQPLAVISSDDSNKGWMACLFTHSSTSKEAREGETPTSARAELLRVLCSGTVAHLATFASSENRGS
jgi:hypothetical protein